MAAKCHVLNGLAGEVILDFSYDDRAPWPEEADGDGAALGLVDPSARPDHGLAASWRASRLIDGSPGGDEDEFDLDVDGLPDDWELFWFGDLAQSGDGDLDMDGIDHILPALAIQRSAPAAQARSTVGTVTEIHDYLRLLFARIGKPLTI